MTRTSVAKWSELADRVPAGAQVGPVALVVVRHDDQVSVLYGRCPHRGALMCAGAVSGETLICASHSWDFDLRTGVSPSSSSDRLQRFSASIDLEADQVFVDADELAAWWQSEPQTFESDEDLGA